MQNSGGPHLRVHIFFLHIGILNTPPSKVSFTLGWNETLLPSPDFSLLLASFVSLFSFVYLEVTFKEIYFICIF